MYYGLKIGGSKPIKSLSGFGLIAKVRLFQQRPITKTVAE